MSDNKPVEGPLDGHVSAGGAVADEQGRDHGGVEQTPSQGEAASVGEVSEIESGPVADTPPKLAPSVAEGGTPVPGSTLSAEQLDQFQADIIAALKTVHDPEIPTDIYELGLIYKIDVGDNHDVDIDMTLTAPGCPVAGEMPGWVENAVASVPGVNSVNVKLVFDPPWDMSRMSDEARLEIGMF